MIKAQKVRSDERRPKEENPRIHKVTSLYSGRIVVTPRDPSIMIKMSSRSPQTLLIEKPIPLAERKSNYLPKETS